MVVGVGVGEDVGDQRASTQRQYSDMTIADRVAVVARRLGDHQRAVGADLGDRRAVVGPAGQRRYGVWFIAVGVGVVAQQVVSVLVRPPLAVGDTFPCTTLFRSHRRVVGPGDRQRQGR